MPLSAMTNFRTLKFALFEVTSFFRLIDYLLLKYSTSSPLSIHKLGQYAQHIYDPVTCIVWNTNIPCNLWLIKCSQRSVYYWLWLSLKVQSKWPMLRKRPSPKCGSKSHVGVTWLYPCIAQKSPAPSKSPLPLPFPPPLRQSHANSDECSLGMFQY